MNEYYTVREVSKILRLSSRTVRKYIAQGKIPAVRFTPKTIRVPKKELLEYMIRASTNQVL